MIGLAINFPVFFLSFFLFFLSFFLFSFVESRHEAFFLFFFSLFSEMSNSKNSKFVQFQEFTKFSLFLFSNHRNKRKNKSFSLCSNQKIKYSQPSFPSSSLFSCSFQKSNHLGLSQLFSVFEPPFPLSSICLTMSSSSRPPRRSDQIPSPCSALLCAREDLS